MNELKNDINIPLNILDIKQKKSFKFEVGCLFCRKNTKEDLYNLFSSLAMMLNSTLTLNESIELLLKAKQSNTDKEILNIIKLSLTTSVAIETSLNIYKSYLGETTILFLKLGLKNGNIKESINSIVEVLGEEIKIKEKLLKVIRYPIVLLISLSVAIVMIFVYVLPNFQFVFTLLKDDIPFATQSLLFLKEIVTKYYYILVAIIFLVYFSFITYYKINKIFIDKIILTKIPLFSKMLQSYYFYKLFLSLSIIVKSKYQLQVAIENSQKIVNNSYLQEKLNIILINIKNGLSIVDAFSKASIFDDFTLKLIGVVQHTSNYEIILQEITTYYKQRFQKSIQNFSSTIEPIIIFIISMIVLWLILAIMLPIWEMSSIIQ